MESIHKFPAQDEKLGCSFISILDTIFKNCPDGIVFKDKNLKYMCANKAFYQLYNIKTPKDFLEKTTAKFLSKENQKIVKDVNEAIIKDKQSISYIMNFETKETNTILNITSTPIFTETDFIGIITIIKDITHEESVKERFVAKHFQLKSLLENIPMLIYMQDKDHNYIAGTRPSQSFVKDGYDAFSNIQVNQNQQKDEDFKENQYVLDNNKMLVSEKKLLDFKETPHWYKIYKVPINDYNGDVTGIITLANNIDSEKQLQAQRETFVASIGHDLKNPTIAQIRGLELLLKGDFGDMNPEQKELIEMVLDSCRYMNGMLATLLATYRNHGGVIKLNFEEFSLPELVTECVSEMIYVAKDKNIKIQVESNLKLETVSADRVQIKRVIMNLLSNGIKYAFKSTPLNLKIYTEDNKTCFEFVNESPYIPEDKQKAIFAQYVSYAQSHNELGIGLGLYASQKIINGHDGHIFVLSSKENKNTFGFKIPTKQKQNSANKDVVF